MQLRSGKIVGAVSTKSPLEMAKYKVRKEAKKRQRATADKHTEKAVTQVRGMLALFIKDIEDVDKSECNRVINRTRNFTSMFEYANSISPNTMMHHRMLKTTRTMLKLCAKTTQEIQYETKKSRDEYEMFVGIYKHFRVNVHKLHTDLHNYNMHHFNALQAELDKFTNTYANRV